MSADKPFRKGQWVQVYGQVVDKPCHVEDVVVEMFSHNEQLSVPLRIDRVRTCAPPTGIAGQCLHLYASSDSDYSRCGGWKGHDGGHTAGDWSWTDDETTAYVEER